MKNEHRNWACLGLAIGASFTHLCYGSVGIAALLGLQVAIFGLQIWWSR